ncbi:hypothetical protein H4S14_003093 [Agrobacterium vitis]|nr:hypothetical protein [Agrobacterium vitis]
MKKLDVAFRRFKGYGIVWRNAGPNDTSICYIRHILSLFNRFRFQRFAITWQTGPYWGSVRINVSIRTIFPSTSRGRLGKCLAVFLLSG